MEYPNNPSTAPEPAVPFEVVAVDYSTDNEGSLVVFLHVQQSNTTPSTVIAQIPSLLFQIGASEVDKDQHSEIIILDLPMAGHCSPTKSPVSASVAKILISA